MKKIYLFLLLGLAACGGGIVLTKTFCDSEKARSDAYYDGRAYGLPFSSHFYNECDSIRASLPESSAKLLKVYNSIANFRPHDSDGTYTTFLYAKALIHDGFDIAKGEAKK